MGDVLSLIEEAERKIDKKKAEKFATKMTKGKRFTLEDFKEQIQQMDNMGGMMSMMDKLPGMGQMVQAAQAAQAEKGMGQLVVIINSMTLKERRNPDIIIGSRKKRIAQGSGTQIQDVNRLLKQHKQMAKMMKKVSGKGGMAKMMRGMKGMMPPGMGGGGGFPPMR
jgi:signal recognition particle subunit SRP54